MFTSRPVRALVVAAGLCLWAGAGPGIAVSGQQAPAPPPPEAPPAAQAPASQQPAGPPTFRTDANFVLTDAFVTADGKPVTDLTVNDFEIKEDGVLQTIQSFEAVLHRPETTTLVPRRDPSTVAESNAMIADPRRRVFVVFLDTFHVDKGSSMWAREQLQAFLKTALGPDDLIAYMTPHMSGMDLSFSTTTEPLVRYFDDNPVWGVADEMPGTEADAIERDLQTCFVGNDQAWVPLRRRLREQRTLTSLHGVVAFLDGQREARKAVIVVTGGWSLFTDNPTLMSDKDTKGRVVGADPIGVGPDGRLGTPDRNRIGGVAQNTCDATRLEGASAESRQSFQDLIGEANRSSTSFYSVDVHGLRTETRPMPTTSVGAIAESRNRERMPFSLTSDSIRQLGERTNGMAIVDTNDLKKGLERAAADFNSYYLLGYTSTNGKADGRYRKIKVTVKRPGVQVRAREGYLARRPDEAPANSPTAAGPAKDPGAAAEERALSAALGKLMPVRPGVPFVVSAISGAAAGGTARVIRVVAELDARTAASPEWAEGAEGQAFVRDLKGEIVTSAKGTIQKGSRTLEIELPVTPTMQGDVKVQVRLQGQGPLARYTDTTSVSLDSQPGGWGAPRLSRRGPSTGIAWVPTADPRFRRQERIRVTVGPPADAAPGTVAASLLDRQGKPMNIPVKVEQSEPTALVAELALAPLAAGDYILALGGGPNRLLVPLRIVP
jgi:VWFA-related protein